MIGRLISLVAWVALTASIVMLAATVLPACELNLAGFRLSYCPAIPAPPAPRTIDPLDVQMAEIRRLERELLARPVCRLTPQSAPPAAPETPRPPVSPTSIDRPECFTPRRAPVAIAVDASGSMRLPIDLSPADDRRLESRSAMADTPERRALEQEFKRQIERTGIARRLDVVRTGVAPFLTGQGSEARAVIFRGCGDINTYSGTEASAAVRDVGPGAGTDIIAALTAAASTLPAGPSTIVMVSDGTHTCGGDVCAATRELKSRMPGTIVNVIDLAGWSALECVARESGGILRRANNVSDIGPMLRSFSTNAPSGTCEAVEKQR